ARGGAAGADGHDDARHGRQGDDPRPARDRPRRADRRDERFAGGRGGGRGGDSGGDPEAVQDRRAAAGAPGGAGGQARVTSRKRMFWFSSANRRMSRTSGCGTRATTSS